MLRRAVISFFAVACFAFVGTFVYTMWVLGNPSRLPLQLSEQRFTQIEQGAELVRTFVYEGELKGASLISPVINDWIGLSSTEFALENPQWRVVSFAPHRVVVEESCESPTLGGFIRLEQGQLFVFDGNMDGCHRRRGPAEVDAQQLSPFQSRELSSGIPFASEIDLSLILDGMRAP